MHNFKENQARNFEKVSDNLKLFEVKSKSLYTHFLRLVNLNYLSE